MAKEVTEPSIPATWPALSSDSPAAEAVNVDTDAPQAVDAEAVNVDTDAPGADEAHVPAGEAVDVDIDVPQAVDAEAVDADAVDADAVDADAVDADAAILEASTDIADIEEAAAAESDTGKSGHPVDLVLGPDGILAACIPHYEDRPGQRSMAQAVSAAFEMDDILLVEAGTGTGKTMAYLVPALLSGRQVVISTGSRALQDQISQRDIPLLEEIIPRRFRAVTLKGVSNYLCLRKLRHGHAAAAVTDDAMRRDYERIAVWAEESESGDRVEVEDIAEDAPIWSLVSNTPNTRLGPRCPFYEECFITKARRRAEKADVIVVNHHLFFADLALRHAFPGARVLPAYEAVVFDEAHQLEDVMTEHFGVRVSATSVTQLGRDARRAFDEPDGPLFVVPTADNMSPPEAVDAPATSPGHALLSYVSAWERIVAHAEHCGANFFRAAHEALVEGLGSSARFAIDDNLLRTDTCHEAWLRLDSALEDLHHYAMASADELVDPIAIAAAAQRRIEANREADQDRLGVDFERADGADRGRHGVGSDEPEAAADAAPVSSPDQRAEQLYAIARRASAMRDALAVVAEQAEHEFIYWGEHGSKDLALCAAPVDVSPYMRDHVLAQAGAVVLTSATLQAEGRFDYVRGRLGLDEELAQSMAVPSPFDYGQQAMLYLPRDLPEPRHPDCVPAACERIQELCAITDGRAFVLFTSHRVLRAAAQRLADVLPGPLLVQGDMPRAALIERFRARPGSVLLGTGTFWEGVDVPGDALSLVIIDKLPFAPHTDPLVRARMQQVAYEGGDPFAGYQLPQAALALKQGFGRLIRRSDDRGIVAVLDPRIVTRRYGRAFIDTLPDNLLRTSVLEQVRRWWQRAAT